MSKKNCCRGVRRSEERGSALFCEFGIAIFRKPLHFHGHAWRFSHFSQRGDAFYALGPMGTTIHVRPEDLTHANAAQLLARHVRQTHYWSSMTKPPAQNNRRAIVGGACHPGPHYGPYDALCGSGKGRGVRTTPPITANLSPITNRPLSGSRRAAQARTGPAWTGPGGPPAGRQRARRVPKGAVRVAAPGTKASRCTQAGTGPASLPRRQHASRRDHSLRGGRALSV